MRLGSCVIKFDEPRIMGIVNNTPDSFSGDGLGGDVERAVGQGRRMFESGASIVDVGGESTRPGATPVSADIEIKRTVPVIERLSKLYPGRVSIDTMKPEVAKSALFAGASLVNDVSGLRDPRMLEVVADHGASVVIMHMLGVPRTMQIDPRYKDVVKDILEFLKDRISAAEKTGIKSNRIIVDPGIGFGKTLEHNLEILGRVRELKALGKPVLIGVSRKAFIGKLTGQSVEKRLEGSIAAAVLAVMEGADMVRVHDVPETVQALMVASAIRSRIPKRQH